MNALSGRSRPQLRYSCFVVCPCCMGLVSMHAVDWAFLVPITHAKICLQGGCLPPTLPQRASLCRKLFTILCTTPTDASSPLPSLARLPPPPHTHAHRQDQHHRQAVGAAGGSLGPVLPCAGGGSEQCGGGQLVGGAGGCRGGGGTGGAACQGGWGGWGVCLYWGSGGEGGGGARGLGKGPLSVVEPWEDEHAKGHIKVMCAEHPWLAHQPCLAY
jgi:hypothetical protein